MSLPDYYCGDYDLKGKNPNAYEPLAGCDMMAHNVGDHNAWSKALYGWISPYVVSGNAEITIESTTDTGEFVIIPTKTKVTEGEGFYTLLDQFIMVEYLTPTGVAEYDTKHQYAGAYPIWYSQPGIRITLVDARLGMFNYSGTFLGFTASVSAGSGYYTSFACNNNSLSRSCFENFKLIEIIPNGNKKAKTLDSNEFGSNSLLYHEGDWFGSHGNFDNFMVHDKTGDWDTKKGKGDAFGFEINIKRMDENGARLVINTL